MGDDELIRHFFGGFVRLHILYHAAKEAICGIEMIEELHRHGYRLSPGTLYPILHHLEQAGYLTCEDAVVSGKRRKNYRITKGDENCWPRRKASYGNCSRKWSKTRTRRRQPSNGDHGLRTRSLSPRQG
jgi:DNA-binding PadR family transcriptional regulator